MAANTFNVEQVPTDGAEFYVSYESTDLSAGADLVAKVAGKSHYITHIQVRTATEMNVDIGSGEGAAGTVSTRHIGLIALNAASGFFPWKAPRDKGMKCTTGAAFTVDVSAAGQIWIEVWGKTCLG